MNEKNFPLIALALFVVGGVSGYGVGLSTGNRDTEARIRGKLESSGLIVSLNRETLSISGKVRKVDGNKVTVLVPAPFDPVSLSPKQETIYTLTVPGSAKITERSMDLNLLRKVPKKGEVIDPFVDKVLKVSDLKTGDEITAFAAVNINNVSSFTVTSVMKIGNTIDVRSAVPAKQ